MLTGPLHRFLVRMPLHDWNANDRAEAAKVRGDVGQKAVDEVERVMKRLKTAARFSSRPSLIGAGTPISAPIAVELLTVAASPELIRQSPV